jgi:protein-L-isoaspartate(D-aspartate) O-methyltransferase
LAPREKFVLQQNLSHVYEHAGPPIVGRMTSNIEVKLGERVLGIGTGPGYQSAYLAHLTNQALRAAGVALPPTVRDAAAS